MLGLFSKARQGVSHLSKQLTRIQNKRALATLPTGAQEEGGDDGLTYQNDITVDNLKELTDIFHGDPNMAQAHVFSENNLKAMTVASENPWTTVRNEQGKLVACVITTRCGDSIARSTGIFVLPEYRKRQIAQKLFNFANRDNLTRFPLGGCQYVVRDGVFITSTAWPNEKLDDRICVRVGVPEKYNPDNLPSGGDDFTIVPYERGRMFDKLVYWDTSRVHWIPRQDFLKAFLSPDKVTTYVALDKKTENVVGYASMQLAFNPKSHIVGPLYGENDQIALSLFRKIMEHYIPGNNIGAMHSESNTAIGKAIEDMGIPIKVMADSRYTHDEHRHPLEFRKQVYLISNCGTMFN